MTVKKEATPATRSSARLAKEEPAVPATKPVAKVAKKDKAPAEKSKTLEVGDKLPPLILQNENEENVDLIKESKNGLVVFFYPKASTPGCTTQACLFRDSLADFQAKGFKVYGCSGDTPKAQLKFKEKHDFGYSLLCDVKHEFMGLLGVSKAKKIGRSHVVIKGGVILDFVKVSPKESSVKALEFIAGLK